MWNSTWRANQSGVCCFEKQDRKTEEGDQKIDEGFAMFSGAALLVGATVGAATVGAFIVKHIKWGNYYYIKWKWTHILRFFSLLSWRWINVIFH